MSAYRRHHTLVCRGETSINLSARELLIGDKAGSLSLRATSLGLQPQIKKIVTRASKVAPFRLYDLGTLGYARRNVRD